MDDPAADGGADPVTGKSPTAFRTITEVATELDLPQHVLRFWESKFPQIKPLKRAGGRRYYRPEDILLLRRIRALLYADGYTIRGAQKLLRERARGGTAEEPPPHEGNHASEAPTGDGTGIDDQAVRQVLRDLQDMRETLRKYVP